MYIVVIVQSNQPKVMQTISILLPAGNQAALNLAQALEAQQFINRPSSTNDSDVENKTSGDVCRIQTEKPIKKRQRLRNVTEEEKLSRG